MSIQLISISHKIAPLKIRELFAFSKEQQEELMRNMVVDPLIEECIVVATCNRTEVYTYTSAENSPGEIFQVMEKILLREAKAEKIENIMDYILFYHNKKAIHHLFEVTTGLDSMVIGEDQILGQVKTAQEQAMEIHTSGVFLNTLFRYAITGAKKVKTDTDLSKTSVSTATLALKIAEKELGTLHQKKVLIIGASGKIGGIVMKNFGCIEDVKLYVTVRSINSLQKSRHMKADYETISYDERYEILDEMDVIISATSSPHYTLTYDKIMKNLKTKKKRVFVDLAVPMDIESKIREEETAVYYNIDNFTKISRENNEKKMNEAKAAGEILDDYELQFERWFIFQKSLPIMQKMRDNFLKVAEHKGTKNAFDHLFYWVRENNSPEDLQVFFDCLNH